MHSKAPIVNNATPEKLSGKPLNKEVLSQNTLAIVEEEKFLQISSVLREKSVSNIFLQEKVASKNFPQEKMVSKPPQTKNASSEQLREKTIWRQNSRFTPAFQFCFLMLFLLNPHFTTCGQPVVRRPPRQSSILSDSDLLELVQRQTFRYFWEYGHPVSGLARERTDMGFGKGEVCTIGGSGFGLMSMVVASERKWVSRQAAAARVDKTLQFLSKADRFHGVFPHWMNGTSGKIIKFHEDDNAGDLVESSFLVQGILTVRQYFKRKNNDLERRIRSTAEQLWREVEWTRHMPEGEQVLTWGDPHQPGIDSLNIEGWNEGMITYILAAASPTYPINAQAYHKGWADDGDLQNGKQFYDIRLPLGSDFGGPLFFAHYSFLGLDPHGLKDRYADYWEQNVNHTLINFEHCVRNPNGFKGYSNESWGLTASTSPEGYTAHSPTKDVGTIAPTAALSSMPYTPEKSMKALHYFHQTLGPKLWGLYGFKDAFNEGENWYSEAFLAIDQGPIILMIENHRTGLLWKLFMSCPEVHVGLKKLGFESPYMNSDKP